MACDECIKIGIPKRLCNDDKPYPVDFLEDETIFRRHNEPGDINVLRNLSEARIGNEIFKLDNDSYNRSLFSNVLDILLNQKPSLERNKDYYKDCGIISLKVGSVNLVKEKAVINEVERLCTLKVVHTSDSCNHSHCEIYCYLDGERYLGKAPKSARPVLRRQLQKLLRMEKQKGK